MRFSRRRFVKLAAGATMLSIPRVSCAGSYPERPVHLIVGFTPGSTPDIAARLIAQWLSKRLGQQFVVENRTGAAGNIATELVSKSPGDGYMLLLLTITNAVNATLYDHLSFNFLKDVTPVASIMRTPLVMEINPAVPARTVAEFISYAKANPGKINMASAGDGTVQHIAGSLFMMMTGTDMVHVPYRENPLPDVIAGQTQVIFNPISSSLGYVRDARLRALGVTTAARAQALPDVPTVGEFVPGYEAGSWYGIGASKATPPALIEKLNGEVNAALLDPDLRSRLIELGAEPAPMTPPAFGQFLADETGKWGKVVRAARIRVD